MRFIKNSFYKQILWKNSGKCIKDTTIILKYYVNNWLVLGAKSCKGGKIVYLFDPSEQENGWQQPSKSREGV